ITLIDSSARIPVISTSSAGQELLPMPLPDEVADLIADVEKGHGVAVSDLLIGEVNGLPYFLVGVPARGMPDAAPLLLIAVVRAWVLQRLLNEAGMRPDWVSSGIVDRNGMLLARSRSPQRFIGHPATPQLVTIAKSDAQVGLFDGDTLEGIAVMNAFRRSPLTGWLSVVGVPRSMMEAPYWRTLALIVAVGFAVIAVSLVLAFLMAGRISNPVRGLGAAAVELAGGKPLAPMQFSITELQ